MTGSREESWVVVGEVVDGIWAGRRVWRSSGEVASVGFSWRQVLGREERRGDVIGWYHTHPSGLLRPSARDVRTMAAWCTCFGKPLLCAIGDGERLAGFLFGRRYGEQERASEQPDDYQPLQRLVTLRDGRLVGVE